MKVAGVIAEYNPFHKGHALQLQQLRQLGYTHIAVAMGGNFLQRGSAAICSKHLRAQMALLGGADLVVELPLGWACAPAQRFANGGVALLEALGCRTIAFGSECGSLALLQQAAQASQSEEVSALTQQLMADGRTFAAARQAAMAQLYPDQVAAVFDNPNDNLCVEYLLALQSQDSGMQPLALQRVGAAHDSAQAEQGIASASHIRELILAGSFEEASSLLPQSSWQVLRGAIANNLAPAHLQRAEAAILARLRSMSTQDFSALPDLSEGLENRLYTAARQACSLEEFYQLAKTKRYTLARIRRLTMAAFLGLRKDELPDLPPYLRVLGFNARGQELMTAAKQKNTLPLSHSLARLEELGGTCAATARLEAQATDLYGLMTPVPLPCGQDYREKV
ncbi:MAG: nucleotidyltransferase family protein, partial [Oscillospiraceae bacterium]|nr:nucleotidyltransferase family protein [Oscillospiraceae bacterium]